MPAVSVNTIIARAKDAADMQDNFVTATTWLRWFNLERVMLDMFIARSGYVLTPLAATVVTDGSTSYELPELMAVLGVYEIVEEGGPYRRIKHSDVMDGGLYRSTLVQGPATEYQLYQNSDGTVAIGFYPIPQSGTYLVRRIPHPTTVATTDNLDTTTVTYPMGWEERIVLGMARRALAKEESPTGEISRQIKEVEQFIEEAAQDRIFGAHQRVRNVDKVERGWTSTTETHPSEWRWM